MKINFEYTKELLTLNEIYNKNNTDNLRIVGGAVRNFLLDRKINDYDLSSKILPEDGVKLLEKNNIKVIPTGIKFGTITAIINNKTFEITTTRKDIKTDGRHAKVEFTDDFKIDAGRRDFTFNALYLDFNNNIYDYFDGITDLKKGIVRFIGDAEQRIKEDYLRILRFFRFFSYYGIVLDNYGLKYSILYKDGLNGLSGERIKSEMFKMFAADYPLNALHIMNNNNILQIATGLNNFDFYYIEILYSLKKYLNIKFSCSLVLSLFLKNIDELNILREKWRLSKKENIEIFNILKHKDDNLYTEKDIKILLFSGIEIELLLKIIVFNSIIHSDEINCNLLQYINNKINFAKTEKAPILLINGKDLNNNGFEDKQRYSFLLNKARELFIESDFILSKNDIIKKLKNEYN